MLLKNMNKKICLTVFMIIQILFLSSTSVIGESEIRQIIKQNTENEYPSGLYLIIGVFKEKNIDDSGYCSQYIFNYTKGMIIGYKLDFNEDGSIKEKGILLVPLIDKVLSIPTFDSINIRYIGNNFLCAFTQHFRIQ